MTAFYARSAFELLDSKLTRQFIESREHREREQETNECMYRSIRCDELSSELIRIDKYLR